MVSPDFLQQLEPLIDQSPHPILLCVSTPKRQTV
jgi:hypothetical protein